MQTLDDLYLKEERELKIYYSTLLLAELLKLNHEYSNKEYNNICGDNVFDITISESKFTETEKIIKIKNALTLLEIKYGYIIKKDFIKQYQDLDFKKKKEDLKIKKSS